MNRNWGMPEADLLQSDEAAAALLLHSSLGFDVLSQPEFWERIIARQLGGSPTRRKDLHDVEVTIWARQCRAEVKYSRAFLSVYKPIRGKDWTRHVFKWMLPRGNSGKAGVHACILVGRDIDGLLFCWVVPVAVIHPNCASITITAPSYRKSDTHSVWDRWFVPWNVMLPAFAAACHNIYDAPMRLEGRRSRARAKMAIGDLLSPNA